MRVSDGAASGEDVSEVPRLAGGLTPPIELLARYLFGGDHYMKASIVPGWAAAYHLGSHYCRPINTPSGPGSTYSQHAFGLGNALDIGLPNNDEGHRVGDEIAAFCRARPELFSQVLWRGVALHYPGHIHVSGNPMGSGTPECKGGPKCPIKPALPLSALGIDEEEDMSKEYEDAQVNKAIGTASGHGLDKMKANGFRGDKLPSGAKELADTPAKFAGFWFALGKIEASA